MVGMSLSLVDQLKAASRVSMREAEQKAAENRTKAERQVEIRAKQWASRRAGKNIFEELIRLLPKREESAVSLGEIKRLMSDMALMDSTISSSISTLVKQKRVLRTGARREYRYYVAGEQR